MNMKPELSLLSFLLLLGFQLRQIAFTTQLAGVEEVAAAPPQRKHQRDKVAFQEFEQEREGVGKDRASIELFEISCPAGMVIAFVANRGR